MTAPDVSLVDVLVGFERALARRDGEGIEGGLGSLIDDAFVEFGTSGRTWDRDAILELLASAPTGVVTIDDVRVHVLAADVVLVTYRTHGIEPGGREHHAARSSVWIRREGRWRLRFHQGTATRG